MSLQVLALLLSLLQSTPAAEAQTSPFLGRWEGRMIETPGVFEIDFAFDLAREADGLRGRLDWITQGTGIQDVEKLTINGPEISFATRDAQGVVTSFDGFLADGAIKGDLREGDHHAPFTLSRGTAQPREPVQLVDLEVQPDELRNRFNADKDRLRVVMIVSPTCGGCRMGALLMQRYVLAQIADPRLRVYVVWEGVARRDSPSTAAESGALLADPRVVHFWSAKRYAGNAFKETLKSEKTLWDVFLVYVPGRVWEGPVPVPDDFMHNRGRELPSEKLFNGIELASWIRSRLTEPGKR